ncbi:MAG: hypothetical protein WCK67_07910 [bacterium]
MPITSQLICNKFGGIRQVNSIFSSAIITASDCQNIELYDTGINGGVGIRTMKGNINISSNLIPSGEKVINIFESIQKGNKYFFVHTVSATEGKVYLFDINNSLMTPKLTGLAVTSVSCGKDFLQGTRDLFIFANGSDKFRYIEIGGSPETGIINAIDSQGREIRGLGLVVFAGRMFTFIGNRVHYCVTANINDWSTSNAMVSTSAGFIEFVKYPTAIALYLTSIAVFFNDSSVQISDNYPFTVSDESPGGCAGYDAFIFHGTDLYFYDDTKKGIFSFKQIVLGNKTLGENIAIEIKSELQQVDTSRLNEIKTLSIVLNDRNEIWFYLPDNNSNSTILIYDYLKGEWLKRVCQKINCFRVVNNKLYSGSNDGKVYQEYTSDSYDNLFIEKFYKTTALNLGSNTTLKALVFPPRIAVDLPYINIFWVKYIKNYDVFKTPKIKQIVAKFKNYLIWGAGYWGKNYWVGKSKINSIQKLPNISAFKTLEMTFYTTQNSENFAIKNIEFSKIKVVQV